MIKEMFKVLREIPGSGWVRIVEFTLGLTFAITAIGVCTSVYAAQKFNGVVTDADILTTLILCAGLTIPTSTAMMVMIEKLLGKRVVAQATDRAGAYRYALDARVS